MREDFNLFQSNILLGAVKGLREPSDMASAQENESKTEDKLWSYQMTEESLEDKWQTPAYISYVFV